VLDAGDDAHEGGLAAARRTHEHHELAFGHRQRNVVQCGRRPEALDDAVELDGCHKVPLGVEAPCSGRL